MSSNLNRASRAGRLAAILMGGSALAGFLPVHAIAQTGTEAASAAEVVTVTAQRREQNILDVPYNITAVSGDQIEKLQIRDNAELMRSIPGVTIVDRGERNGSVVNGIRIRGLNVDSSALGDYSVSAASTVSTYVNDTPIFSNFMLKDIERVEVLKGPQATLYGSGSLGGTVRYILRSPEFDSFTGSATVTASQVSGSSNVGYSEDLTLNVPLGETVAFRATATRFDYPGITDYVNVYKRGADKIPTYTGSIFANNNYTFISKKDADNWDGWYGRASLLWKPASNFDITFNVMGQSDKFGGRRAQTLGMNGFGVPYKDKQSGAMLLEPGDRDVWLASAEANLDLGFATLTSSSSYYDHQGSLVSDNTGFYAQNGWLGAFYYNYPRPLAEADRTYGDKAFIQEVRLVSNSSGPWDYAVGFYYQNQIQSGTQDSYLRGFKNWADAFWLGPFVISDQDYLYRRSEQFTETALYGELTYHVNDKLQFTGGLRAFKGTSNAHVYQVTGLYTSYNETSNTTGSTDKTKLLFKGNVSYKFLDDDLFYATISQGYRRGGSNGTPTTGFFAESPAWLSYSPDTVVNYEAGLKGTWGDIIYNIDAFYVDWNKPQLNTATTFWGFFAVANGKSATTKGIEAQIDGYAGNWHYGLGYTFTQAELGADLYTADGLILINKKGADLPGAPEHILTGALDYTVPMDDDSLTLHLDGYYQSKTQNTISSATSSLNSVDYPGQPKYYAPMDGFAIFNASATYAMGDWTATAWVKNIFDSQGVTGVYTEAYMGTSPSQNYYGNASKEIYALPRTIGLTINYKFK